MRLLVLDGSRVLHSLIRRLTPLEVEVESALTFEEAVECLENDPPDAAIVNLTPSPLPWRQLKVLCQVHEPQIPVLFESCVFGSADDAGLGRIGPSASFLTKPYSVTELSSQIERLLSLAGREPMAPPRQASSRSRPKA